jgi:hypothetical protein
MQEEFRHLFCGIGIEVPEQFCAAEIASGNDLLTYCELYKHIPRAALTHVVYIPVTEAQKKRFLLRQYLYRAIGEWLEYLLLLRREPPFKFRKWDGRRGYAQISKARVDLIQAARLHPDLPWLRQLGPALMVALLIDIEHEIETLYNLGIIGYRSLQGLHKKTILRIQQHCADALHLDPDFSLSSEATNFNLDRNKIPESLLSCVDEAVLFVAQADGVFHSQVLLPFQRAVKTGLNQVNRDKTFVYLPTDRQGRGLGKTIPPKNRKGKL